MEPSETVVPPIQASQDSAERSWRSRGAAMKSADSNSAPGLTEGSVSPEEPSHHVAIVHADETREQRPERGATSGERGDFLRGPRRGHEEGREVRGVVADKAEAEGRGAGRRRGRSRQVSVTSCSSKPTKVAPRGSRSSAGPSGVKSFQFLTAAGSTSFFSRVFSLSP